MCAAMPGSYLLFVTQNHPDLPFLSRDRARKVSPPSETAKLRRWVVKVTIILHPFLTWHPESLRRIL